MRGIWESFDGEERLVVNVGTPISRVSNSSSISDPIDRVSDICPSGEGEGGLDNVYSNIAGFN